MAPLGITIDPSLNERSCPVLRNGTVFYDSEFVSNKMGKVASMSLG